jgi:hypothetical protein
MAEVRQMGALLAAGRALPCPLPMRCAPLSAIGDIFALMRDLRAMGETNALNDAAPNARRRGPSVRTGRLPSTQNRFPDEAGRIRATFEVIFLTGWAPA